MITLGRLDLHLAPGTAPGLQAALRRRAASALGYADLAPRALPPQAVLVVRRLADPLPGELLAGSPWQSGGRWGEGARAEVARLWRSAARPAHGPVPPDAQAVWFADQAEWLACLSLDLHQGVAHLRWWWLTRLSATSARGAAAPGGPPQLSTLWRAEARTLPAALAYLHGNSRVRVADMLEKIPAPELQNVLHAVLSAHALPETVLDQPIAPETRRRWIPGPERIASRSPGVEAAAALLLGAWYAPAALRRHALRGLASTQGQVAQTTSGGEEPPEANPAPLMASVIERDLPREGSDLSTKSAESLQEYPEPSPVASYTTTRKAEPAASVPAAYEPQGEADMETLAEGARPRAAPTKPAKEPDPAAGLTPAELSHGLLTGLGGVWLLVNVLSALAQLEGEVSPWLKLEVLARRLLAEPPEDDPLWEALAELAGSERTPAGLQQASKWLSGEWPRLEAWLLERLESLDALSLQQRATCYLTQTHLDVVYAIDEISLPLRLAGLDRDPGWVPQLGRVIQFHFE